MTPRSVVETLEARKLLSAAVAGQDNPSLNTVEITWNESTAQATPGQWIVQLGGYDGLAGSQLQKARRLLSNADGDVFVRQYLVADGLFSVRTPTNISVEQQYAKLAAMPGFVSAEPDWVYQTQLTPNDPSYPSLTGLNQGNDHDIDAPEAWNNTQGSMSQIVGIIDSGVDYNHPDLYQNAFLNPGEIPATRLANLTDVDGDGIITFRDLNNAVNQGVGKIQDQNADGRISGFDVRQPMGTTSGVDNGTGGWANAQDNDSNGFVDDFVGWDFLSGDNDPTDLNGHGTHVAGTVGAHGNNSTGVVGVNWKVRLMAFRTGGVSPPDPSINTSAAIASLNYAAMMKQRGHQVRVTNNSWGGGGVSGTLEGAIQGNANQDIMFVAAAGNDGLNNDITPQYPANYTVSNVISVLNLTSNGNRNGGSNFGATTVDIGAPGTNILSTTPNNTYSVFTGTSMAAPHVAGVAALAFSIAPGATVNAIKTAMFNNTDILASNAGLSVTGGRVNAQKTLSAIAGFPDSPAGVDLNTPSDTGISASDDVTNDTTPTFSGVAPAGSTVRLLVDDVEKGSVFTADGNWTITSTALTDGLKTVTATATNGAGTSSPSTPVFVTIDTVSPTGSNAGFPFAVAPHRTTFNFSEDMSSSFNTGEFTVTNLTASQVIPAGSISLNFNAGNQVQINFPGLANGLLSDGNYRVSVLAADRAGNAMAAPYTYDFYFLNADANRDRKVDIGDFGTLATNFNRTPRNFGQGDFNYSGTVDIDDFSILAQRFNLQLPAATTLPAASPGGATAPSNGRGAFSESSIDDAPADDILGTADGAI